MNNPVYLIQHLANVLSKQSERLLQDELGIGYSQFRILMVLEWNPRVSQRSIADSLGQTEASVSRQIKVLQRTGLLVSKPDPENRRRHITAPTPKGMQLTESANAILRRHFGPKLGTLDDEQLARLIRNLQKLHAAVCNHPLGL
jgi:DNA-binding MarR family transcriptional regulator